MDPLLDSIAMFITAVMVTQHRLVESTQTLKSTGKENAKDSLHGIDDQNKLKEISCGLTWVEMRPNRSTCQRHATHQ